MGTPREECVRSLDDRISFWKERAERIIVQASAEKLAQITEALHAFNPIKVIIDSLYRPDGGVAKITDKDIDMDEKPEKVLQYLTLLEELHFVKRLEDGYTYGEAFTELLTKVKNNRDQLTKYVISDVIEKRYSH